MGYLKLKKFVMGRCIEQLFSNVRWTKTTKKNTNNSITFFQSYFVTVKCKKQTKFSYLAFEVYLLQVVQQNLHCLNLGRSGYDQYFRKWIVQAGAYLILLGYWSYGIHKCEFRPQVSRLELPLGIFRFSWDTGHDSSLIIPLTFLFLMHD